MAQTILYPFTEEDFNEATAEKVAMIKALQKSGEVNALCVVDKEGKTSKLLKKERLAFEVVPVAKQVYPNDFYLKALFILMTTTLAQFAFIRMHKIQTLHCFDLDTLMMWGNAAKMYRVPYFVSLDDLPKTGKMASMLITDAKSVVCANDDIVSRLPRFAKKKATIAPKAEERLPFWAERYNLLSKPFSFTQSTGLPNK